MASSNIFAQYIQPVRSVQDYSNELARGDFIEGQNALQQSTLRQQQRAEAAAAQRSNALRQLLAGATDEDTVIQRLLGSGDMEFVTQGQALDKSRQDRAKIGADVGKAKADATKTTGEATDAALKRYQGMLAYIDTPQGAARWLQAQYQDPATGQLLQGIRPFEEAVQGIPQDPQAFQQWRQQAGIGMEKVAQYAAEMARTKLTTDTQIAMNAATNATSRANNAATNATTQRGQNMTDARSREANSATMTKPFEVTGPDGVPILVRQDGKGNITRVEGFGPKTGASKPLTEGQAKGLLFGSRAQEADKILSELEGAGVTRPGAVKQSAEAATGLIPFIGDKVSDIAGTATNWTQSPDQQRVEQAQRDFVNAVLRRESGAVISPEEFRNAAKQYFPAAGDSPEVRKQKAQNRALATRGLMAEVPEAQRGSITKPTQSGGATVDWSELK